MVMASTPLSGRKASPGQKVNVAPRRHCKRKLWFPNIFLNFMKKSWWARLKVIKRQNLHFFLFLFRAIRMLMLRITYLSQSTFSAKMWRLVYHSQMALVVHLVHQQLQAVNRLSLSGFNLHTVSSISSYMFLVYWRIARLHMLQTPL